MIINQASSIICETRDYQLCLKLGQQSDYREKDTLIRIMKLHRHI